MLGPSISSRRTSLEKSLPVAAMPMQALASLMMPGRSSSLNPVFWNAFGALDLSSNRTLTSTRVCRACRSTSSVANLVHMSLWTGKRTREMASRTEDLPADCSPTTMICGRFTILPTPHELSLCVISCRALASAVLSSSKTDDDSGLAMLASVLPDTFTIRRLEQR